MTTVKKSFPRSKEPVTNASTTSKEEVKTTANVEEDAKAQTESTAKQQEKAIIATEEDIIIGPLQLKQRKDNSYDIFMSVDGKQKRLGKGKYDRKKAYYITGQMTKNYREVKNGKIELSNKFEDDVSKFNVGDISNEERVNYNRSIGGIKSALMKGYGSFKDNSSCIDCKDYVIINGARTREPKYKKIDVNNETKKTYDVNTDVKEEVKINSEDTKKIYSEIDNLKSQIAKLVSNNGPLEPSNTIPEETTTTNQNRGPTGHNLKELRRFFV